jgi:hypothetical protein
MERERKEHTLPRTYQSPQLVCYGTIRDLTHTISGGTTRDSHGGPKNFHS